MDGDTVYKEPKVVLDKWANEFENLLNPTPVMQQDININQQSQHGHVSDPYLDTAIIYLEINKVITRMKLGKAVGVDELPVEALKSECVQKFMLKLFDKCFETEIIPSMWCKRVINPIPKDSTKEPTIEGLLLLVLCTRNIVVC